ncbi:methyl-accepting chemotaxis protein, partial [Salinibacter ruber]
AEAARAAAQENGDIIYRAIEKMEQVGEVVEHSAETINQLGASSEAIGEIVATIDDIADQTNLLALNAAIEQQSATSERVSQNIKEISTVTSQTAQDVTEIAQSAADLSDLSGRLVATTDQFVLEGEDQQAPAASPARGDGAPSVSAP